MSRDKWKSTAVEAAERGRDVISLYISAAETGTAAGRTGDKLAGAIQHAIYPLDDRWPGNSGREKTAVRRDNAFYLSACSNDAIRMVSRGTADLFGYTPATPAARKLAALICCTVDIDSLRNRLRQLPAPAVLSYGSLTSELLKLRSSVRFEFASHAGERSETEISVSQLRQACSFIEETSESSVFLHIRGSLTLWNAKKKTFRIEGEDGRIYSGKVGKDVFQRGGQVENSPILPLVAEAVIERRTVYQVSIDTESVVDILADLDTDPGMKREDALHTIRKLYVWLTAVLEDGGEEEGNHFPVSAENYEELAAFAEQLFGSNPLKGARKALNPADVADMRLLLTDNKPIAKLALADLDESDRDMDEDEAGSYSTGRSAHEYRRRAAAERHKLAAAAYADLVKMASRMTKMIGALEGEEALNG